MSWRNVASAVSKHALHACPVCPLHYPLLPGSVDLAVLLSVLGTSVMMVSDELTERDHFKGDGPQVCQPWLHHPLADKNSSAIVWGDKVISCLCLGGILVTFLCFGLFKCDIWPVSSQNTQRGLARRQLTLPGRCDGFGLMTQRPSKPHRTDLCHISLLTLHPEVPLRAGDTFSNHPEQALLFPWILNYTASNCLQGPCV